MIPSDIDFEPYLVCLRKLAAFATPFNRPQQINTAMDWCQKALTCDLKGYTVFRDRKNNLIACPKALDPDENITYLSAHMDTVDADPLEWDPPFAPFTLYEDDRQMVGRGVSDCKAGAAFELFVAHLANAGRISLSNLIFTLTFKEEGAGMKTACQIGRDLGTILPVSRQDTLFFVLENTMTVGSPPVFSFYTAERGNFVIRVSGTMDRLRSLLARLDHWNPVSIRPASKKSTLWAVAGTQIGGHVCSVPREENLLTRVIETAGRTDLVRAGDESGFAVVPSQIYKAQAPSPAVHHLVLSNRSFDTRQAVRAQLEGIPHTRVKPFSISQGMNFDPAFSGHPLSGMLNTPDTAELTTRHTHNIGASDATIVTRSMAPALTRRFYPVVMGPGTRSQRNLSPPRLTHGKNETFDKPSGKAGVSFLVSLLAKLGHIV